MSEQTLPVVTGQQTTSVGQSDSAPQTALENQPPLEPTKRSNIDTVPMEPATVINIIINP